MPQSRLILSSEFLAQCWLESGAVFSLVPLTDSLMQPEYVTLGCMFWTVNTLKNYGIPFEINNKTKHDTINEVINTVVLNKVPDFLHRGH